MTYLINRSSSAKIDCLHSILRFLSNMFDVGETFSLNDAKYDAESYNVHSVCPLLCRAAMGYEYCPFLDNPMDEAGCLLTHQKEGDTTKSKQVSEAINALHALGLVTRTGREIAITEAGQQFAASEFGTERYQELLEKAVLSYGPCIGILKQICDLTEIDGEFQTGDIVVGYPNTSEVYIYNGSSVVISSGSQRDSNTRTRSCLLTWLTAAGYIRPAHLSAIDQGRFPHEFYRDYINSSVHNASSYYLLKTPAFFGDDSFYVRRPLSFANQTKLIGALRERGMDAIREATMACQERLKNRRFAIVYLLNQAKKQNKGVSIAALMEFMLENAAHFVISTANFERVLYQELDIANMTGIPFIMDETRTMYPLTLVDDNELEEGAPMTIIELLRNFDL